MNKRPILSANKKYDKYGKCSKDDQMTKKMTVTLEEALLDELDELSTATGKKKAQLRSFTRLF